MKKFLAAGFIFTLLLVYNNGLSQEMTNGKTNQITLPVFEIGIKGGLSMAGFFWTGDNGWNNSTMFVFMPVIWAVTTWNITESIALQLEGGYCGKGSSIDASDGFAHWYYHYFDFPVFIKFQQIDGDMRFYAGAGGYFAKTIAGFYDFNVPRDSYFLGKGDMTISESGAQTNLKPYDYGLVFNCGIQNYHWVFEFRFTISLSSVMEFTPPVIYGDTRGALNSGIILTAGYTL